MPTKGGGKPGGGKPAPGGGKPTPGGSTNDSSPARKQQADAAQPTADTTSKDKTTATGPSGAKIARVQMSHEWIEAKLSGAVSDQGLVDTILRSGYSRHLLYVPFYLPSAVQHVEALTTGAEHDHADHDLPFTHHYKEGEVEEAVELKASRIR
ncbi:hypothetical protein [Paraburkholderia bannensis]|uniref:hypothetical protein n=1 Tax=Paraburkholderia bannensis TaxID=765414 RepID=UPI001FE23146|nr:hypothetical protein [Paraburkholderia bannensis]